LLLGYYNSHTGYGTSVNFYQSPHTEFYYLYQRLALQKILAKATDDVIKHFKDDGLNIGEISELPNDEL